MVYISDIITGLILFPIVAALFTLPYVVVQYHKHGSVSKYRTLIIYSFILYMLIAYFMVILPLPDREATIGNTWQDHLNLIPFRQIWLYWHDKPFGLAALQSYIVSMSLWQLLFNILLTVPFGIYMRYYFKLSLKRTLLYSFLLSLFYETSQITALFGIYPGPYRLADVEDLICNTMGGVIGWHIAYVFTKILPSRDEIDAQSHAVSYRITGWRRLWSALFDYLCSYIIFVYLLGIITILVPGFDNYSAYGQIYSWSFFCVFSLIQVIMTKGSTLCHGICRLSIVSEDGGIATTGQFVKRYLYLWLFTDFPLIIANYFRSRPFPALNNDYIYLAVMLPLLLIARLYYVWYFINVIFRKGALMPHDKLSKTVYRASPLPTIKLNRRKKWKQNTTS